MPTQDKHYARMRSAVQIKSLAYKLTKANNSRRHQLTNSQTQKLINSQTQKLTNSQTQKPINS